MEHTIWIELADIFINTVIAIAAFALAVLQYINERRQREKAKAEQEQIHQNVLLIKQIAELTTFTEFTEIAKKYKMITGSKNIDTQSIIQANNYIKEVSIAYKKCIKKLTPLYEKMVVNEEKFSLSYGYGRYIDAFREFITNQEDLIQLVNNIIIMNCCLQNLAHDENEQEQYLNLYCENRKIVEKLYPNVIKIEALIAEIRIKYGEYLDNAS